MPKKTGIIISKELRGEVLGNIDDIYAGNGEFLRGSLSIINSIESYFSNIIRFMVWLKKSVDGWRAYL